MFFLSLDRRFPLDALAELPYAMGPLSDKGMLVLYKRSLRPYLLLRRSRFYPLLAACEPSNRHYLFDYIASSLPSLNKSPLYVAVPIVHVHGK